MAKIEKVGHVVLSVRDPAESAKWYSEVLDMEIMNHMDAGPDLQMAFLSFGTRDHDIALVKAPESGETGSLGLSHTALQVEGGEEELRACYTRLLDHDVKFEFLADHGLTKSVYFFDPDGNRLEIFYQAMHGEEAMQYMRSGRAGLDPYELEPTKTS